MPDASARPEVRLDPALQERLLEQMREEQAAALRRQEVMNWVLVPVTVAAFVISTALSFSADFEVALVANLVASCIGYVLYRVNKARILGWFGRG
ncbi:MAG: hypothetical protein H6719_20930 [Sandaracinaceae bacterium]|nr:hypothetical protein [Sandaracinaceae bacterium]